MPESGTPDASPLQHQRFEIGKMLFSEYRGLSKKLAEAKRQPVPQEVLDAYETNKDTIISLYGNLRLKTGLLYHGTGTLQYSGDKFGEGMSADLRHPLDDILEHGLKPHKDTWILDQDEITSTSFATTWPYAKWFSDLHQNPDQPLAWEYGKSPEWFSYLTMDTIIQTAKQAARDEFAIAKQHLNSPKTAREYASSLRQRAKTALQAVKKIRDPKVEEGLNKLQKWASDIRSDITPDTHGIDILRGKTDITGNMGAIITLSESDVTLIPMGPGGIYEKRTADEVKPTIFRSLAVPLEHVAQYQEKLKDMGYTFPVLPIEAVEYHLSHMPVNTLTVDQRAA